MATKKKRPGSSKGAKIPPAKPDARSAKKQRVAQSGTSARPRKQTTTPTVPASGVSRPLSGLRAVPARTQR
jgi:hypothetical protein